MALDDDINEIDCNEDIHYNDVYNTGIDFKNRQILLIGDIDDAILARSMCALLEMNRQSDLPITIFICTTGGVVYDGFGIIDLILNSKSPITTVGIGKVMSMGFLIFLAGSKREAYSLTTFMTHKGTKAMDDGSYDEIKLEAEEINRLEKISNKFIAERTGYKTEEWWKNWQVKGDRYIDVKKAKKLGIIK